MKMRIRFLLGLFMLVQFMITLPAQSRSEISCGQTITDDTVL
jgi:hypothetical protein